MRGDLSLCTPDMGLGYSHGPKSPVRASEVPQNRFLKAPSYGYAAIPLIALILAFLFGFMVGEAQAAGKRVIRTGPYPYTVERWRAPVERYFPGGKRVTDEALAVIWVESNGYASAVNGSYVGLFQLGPMHGTYALRRQSLYNIRTAARLYVASGYRWGRHWPYTARVLGLR